MKRWLAAWLILSANVAIAPPSALATPGVQDASSLDAARASYFADKDKLIADAAKGKDGAIYELGTLYEQGTPFEPAPDVKAAYQLYQQAAGHSAYAQTKLCEALLTGDPLPKDEARGVDICDHIHYDYSPESAYTQSFVKAYKLEHGIGHAADPAKALKTYASLATVYVPAATMTGENAYAQGNFAEARRWFTANASASLESLVHLAHMVDAGEGGSQDHAEAAWLYSVAAQKGSDEAADWLKQQPAPVTAPESIKPDLNGHDLAIRKNFTDWKLGDKTVDLYVAQSLGFFMPKNNDFSYARVRLTCYITSERRFDICLTDHEQFLTGFGAAVKKAYDGEIDVADTDADGNPTANKLYTRTVYYGSDF